jgi:hypothetical protein
MPVLPDPATNHSVLPLIAELMYGVVMVVINGNPFELPPPVRAHSMLTPHYFAAEPAPAECNQLGPPRRNERLLDF